MMRRGPGYEKPVGNTSENTGLFFGNRQGSIGGKPSTASFKDNETTANTDQSSSGTNATPAKPMYSGNVAYHPSTAIQQSASGKSQYLRVPSPPPSEYLEEPKPFCEASPSSQCGTQAESIKPSWYESSTTFPGKAARSCYTASKSKYDWAAGWYKKGLALTGFRQAAMDSCFGSYIWEMTRTKPASMSIGATARAWIARPPQSRTQCTRRTEAAPWWSKWHHDGN